MNDNAGVNKNECIRCDKHLSRILTIDDDAVNNEIIQEVLGDEFEVRTLLSGDRCEEEIEHYHPQLVLLDIMMPGIDGYVLCRRLKTQAKTAQTRIVMVSAKNMIEDRLKAYEAGADDYLSKPFVCEELLAKVRVHMRLKYVEELNRLKNDMLKLISHETRTPLNGILGNAWLLEQNDTLSAEDRVFTGAITQSARKLMRLIERSELFLYLQQDKSLEKGYVPVRDLLETVIEHKKIAARKKNVTIRIREAPNGDMKIALNSELMEIALGNIVENGIKYCENAGEVAVECHDTGKEIQITVTDNGPGVVSGVREHLFVPFSVADLSHHADGHGISLAIAKRIALMHGGNLSLDDSYTDGARFLFRLRK